MVKVKKYSGVYLTSHFGKVQEFFENCRKSLYFKLNLSPCPYNANMTQPNQKNHRLYEAITPYFTECVREHMDTENRIYITKCEVSKDGKSLLIFVGFSTYEKEDFLQVKKFAPGIRKYLASLQIMWRVPTIYFKRDTGESIGRTIEDILQEIRKTENRENNHVS